jgi:hypothetical protein
VAVGLNWLLLLVVLDSMSWDTSVYLCALLFVVVCNLAEEEFQFGKLVYSRLILCVYLNWT